MRTLLLLLAVSASASAPCLCVFDVDRTLTGQQGSAGSACPADKEVAGISDSAYGGGTLTLSKLAQGVSGTFCDACSLAICSAGDASGAGSKERSYILSSVLGGSARVGGATSWNEYGVQSGKVSSPLVVRQRDGQKQHAVKAIIAWYATSAAKPQTFAPSDVHFFDDRADNVSPFEGTGFNAHQISCASRDTSSK